MIVIIASAEPYQQGLQCGRGGLSFLTAILRSYIDDKSDVHNIDATVRANVLWIIKTTQQAVKPTTPVVLILRARQYT